MEILPSIKFKIQIYLLDYIIFCYTKYYQFINY